MSSSLRVLHIIAGSLCVGLALIGTVVPILPTTPFLLLAAYFYARSSQRFYTWLTTNRWFGEYIRSYREGRGLPLRHKVITIALVWLSIGSAALLAVSFWWMRALLLIIALGVTLHLVKIKTSTEAPPRALLEDTQTPGEAS